MTLNGRWGLYIHWSIHTVLRRKKRMWKRMRRLLNLNGKGTVHTQMRLRLTLHIHISWKCTARIYWGFHVTSDDSKLTILVTHYVRTPFERKREITIRVFLVSQKVLKDVYLNLTINGNLFDSDIAFSIYFAGCKSISNSRWYNGWNRLSIVDDLLKFLLGVLLLDPDPSGCVRD